MKITRPLVYSISDDYVCRDNSCAALQIGRLTHWCCGTDFWPQSFNCLFSILGLDYRNKDHERKLLDCVEEIMSLPLAKLSGKHYNFYHKDYVFSAGQKREPIEKIKANILAGLNKGAVEAVKDEC